MMCNKRTAIVLALVLAIVICITALYDMNFQLPEEIVKNEQSEEVETGSENLPDTEIIGVGDEKDAMSEVDSATESETESEPDEPIVVLNENPLTGEFNLTDGAVGKRPVAVMINNINKAMPQYGVAQADIIFEIPVEGFLTRFMAIYADYTQMPKICSIRSCRPYFPAIAEGFDAVYVYAGMTDAIKEYVDSLNLTVFNGGVNHGGLFGRDQERRAAGYSLEHTLYFDGTGIVEAMEKRKLRSDIEADKEGNAFLFNDVEEQIRPDGDTCTVVEIDFGSAEATLTYDIESSTYVKDLNGNPQIDGVTGTQLAFTNVFVLETTIKTASYGIHKDVDWHGGTGYYVSYGAVQEIIWSKADEESPMKFYTLDGEELSINRGKSYIAINRKDRTEFLSVITPEMVR